MKHILHLITNAVEPTVQAILASHDKGTDLRVTIVTTQNLGETVTASSTPIFSLLDAEEPTRDASMAIQGSQGIDYDRFMDLIFEAETIITW